MIMYVESIIRDIKKLEDKIDEFLENFPNATVTFDSIFNEFEELSYKIKDFYQKHKNYVEKYREKIREIYRDMDKKRRRINRLFNLMNKYKKNLNKNRDEKNVQKLVKNVDKLVLNLVELIELYNKTLLLNVDINTYIDNMAELTINFNRLVGKIYAIEALFKIKKLDEIDANYIR